ncbi:lysoplasmalogenase [Biostraticola tofi]|uniref:Putative membrane protein YhhN n=1 Tax=Biostraticola tofi TaxID=466109 RepID=A0A4R3YWH2_9GAMM|nr:lysoplasmalogenase [Biostraticola tofi]TCV95623.1 putative membrane protein YhhN [Biostraticola tofi]
MLWSFIAVLFSGWLFVDAAYRGPVWQRWLFKPVTLLLLIGLAWQAPVLTPTGYLVVLGLLATLAGDALLLLPTARLMYAIGAFFLCHLLYTIGFATQMTLSVFWPLPLVLLLIGAALIGVLWSRLEELRWPVCTYIGMTLLMVWIAGEHYFMRSTDYSFSLLTGSSLLLLAAISWLISHYRYPFHASRAITAACYFAGHFIIVRSLYL